MIRYFFLGIKTGLLLLFSFFSMLSASISSSVYFAIFLMMLCGISITINAKTLKTFLPLPFFICVLFSSLGGIYGVGIGAGVFLGTFPKIIGSLLSSLLLTMGIWGFVSLN